MVEISTSILGVKQESATRVFYDLEVAKTDYFHIDVMDGKFVENDTTKLMKDYATTIKHISNLPLDVHLMVENTENYISEYLELEPNIITIHYESNKNSVIERINQIKEGNCKAGISIKPNTPIEEIYEYLPMVHLVLIMTVEPGKGGQKLIPSTVEKVESLKQYIDVNGIDIDIEVDGGINLENAETLIKAGANILVSGSTIIGAENYSEVINKLKQRRRKICLKEK